MGEHPLLAVDGIELPVGGVGVGCDAVERPGDPVHASLLNLSGLGFGMWGRRGGGTAYSVILNGVTSAP